jgi:pimeloyl-ACP methyl ester carboxylesterase
MYNWPPSIINQLSLNHTVIIFDNRGVGNTTSGTKPFSIQQFANDTNVLGFSLGSLIAQELTVTHPEKVNRLVLYSSTCGGKDSIPPSPPVLKSYVGVMRNTTDAAKRLVSTLFPQGWIKANPNYFASILLSKEKLLKLL